MENVNAGSCRNHTTPPVGGNHTDLLSEVTRPEIAAARRSWLTDSGRGMDKNWPVRPAVPCEQARQDLVQSAAGSRFGPSGCVVSCDRLQEFDVGFHQAGISQLDAAPPGLQQIGSLAPGSPRSAFNIEGKFMAPATHGRIQTARSCAVSNPQPKLPSWVKPYAESIPVARRAGPIGSEGRHPWSRNGLTSTVSASRTMF